MSSAAQRNATAENRRRDSKRGLTRIELKVPEQDTEGFRILAAKLRDGGVEALAMREAISAILRPRGRTAFEAFASDLPDEVFEGVFEEGLKSDPGRDIDL